MTLPVAILAGGLATRMRPATDKIPKSLLLVAGKPFIYRQLDLLRDQGISDIVLCIGYFGEQIVNDVGDGSKFGMRIRYSYDGDMALGTGGALKKAEPYLCDNFFVIYGDSYLKCNFGNVLNEYNKCNMPALMTVYKNNNKYDKSNIIFKNNKIIEYNKNIPLQGMEHIDYGLTILNNTVLHEIPDNKYYDIADIYINLLKKNKLAGYEIFDRFYEIGTMEGLETLSKLLQTEGADYI
jgi:NDP-sugar pyrophosphorylase family protein